MPKHQRVQEGDKTYGVRPLVDPMFHVEHWVPTVENFHRLKGVSIMEQVIVSRHPAAIEWVAQQLDMYSEEYPVYDRDLSLVTIYDDGAETERYVPVYTQVDDSTQLNGKLVYGVLPMSLAAEAYRAFVIEFTGDPPRGREYSVADMEEAGARLVEYEVRRVTE